MSSTLHKKGIQCPQKQASFSKTRYAPSPLCNPKRLSLRWLRRYPRTHPGFNRLAAKMLHNTEQAGKKVTPGNIAYYTIQHLKSGRRSTGSSTVDVYGSGTQLKGKTRLNSLEEVVASNEENGSEIYELHDVLGSDEEDPGTKAARDMDWPIHGRVISKGPGHHPVHG